jgi:DNA-binding response OmpR family regulator
VGSATARILVVDDERPLQELLAFPLRRDGYEVVSAYDGYQALARLNSERFDLVVLDLMLPGIDGLELCRLIRSTSDVPIVMLTARGDERDKVAGLELGADDYITKPFSLREFRSRVRAVLRRTKRAATSDEREARGVIERGPLRIDLDRRTATVRGRPVRLTYVEFELLTALARRPGVAQGRPQLLASVFGSSAYRDPRTIDVHIRHLREKIEDDPSRPRLIETVRRVGYRFAPLDRER